MSDAVEKFYEADGGDLLVKEAHYPHEISQFLQNERQLLLKILSPEKPYQAMFEVGCMDARNLSVAVDAGCRYFGIDLVDRFIRCGRERIASTTNFDPECICKQSSETLEPVNTPVPAGLRTLAVFPFNSLGNMSDPIQALRCSAALGYDALASTFRTDKASSTVRQEYYSRCGYTDLEMVGDNGNITFKAKEGLHSTSYATAYFDRIAAELSMHLQIIPFSSVGVGYHLTRFPSEGET